MPILIFGIVMGLFAMTVGIYTISIVREALATGRIYSVFIIMDDRTMIYRTDSPEAYWGMIGVFSSSIVLGIGIGIFAPIGTTIAYIKKLARQKKEQ